MWGWKQETEENILDKKNDSQEENLIQIMIINYFEINVNFNTSLMRPWSLLSDFIHYVQCNRNVIDYYKLDINALEPKDHKTIFEKLEEDDSQVIGLDFGDTLEKLKGKYLDVYEGVRSDILYTTKFDENSDSGTIYLSKVNISRSDNLDSNIRKSLQ